MDERCACWSLVPDRGDPGVALGGDRLGLVELGDTGLDVVQICRMSAWNPIRHRKKK
jgi:hypothetical protein